MRPVTRRRLRSPLPCADYAVPDYFRDDLYDTTAKIRAQFPLYRYFVVGGPRTGSDDRSRRSPAQADCRPRARVSYPAQDLHTSSAASSVSGSASWPNFSRTGAPFFPFCGCAGSGTVSVFSRSGFFCAAIKSFSGMAPFARGMRPTKTQACMRPCAPDALPLLGVVQGTTNVVLATGHNCWGILWAPITGKLVSELIADGAVSSIPSLDAFDPARFTPRAKQRGRANVDLRVGEQW